MSSRRTAGERSTGATGSLGFIRHSKMMSADNNAHSSEREEGEENQGSTADEAQSPSNAGEAQSPSNEQQPPTTGRRNRKPRTETKWPTDKITVTEVEPDGMPTEQRAKKRFRRLCGLIARQRVSLLLPNFHSLSNEQKNTLFSNYVTPWLEFPEDKKELAFKRMLMLTCKSWRTYKSMLYRKYVVPGKRPFDEHPHIKEADWPDFVKMKSTDEFKEQSESYKRLREKNVHNHHLGTAGYEGKLRQWEAEDAYLASKGIPNPWDQFPGGRSTWWLRGRSTLETSENSAQIKWKKQATEEVSKAIVEKQTSADSSGLTWVREKDVLTACLGPEHSGRVRGVSSYLGWKHAWPEWGGMYRKRKRQPDEVDIEALRSEVKREIKIEVREEVTAQVTCDIMAMLAAHGVNLMALQTPVSPHFGRKSSCASASINADVANNGPYIPPDSIDLLTEPTDCALLANLAGNQVEVARGRVYPQQTTLHCTPVPDDHAVVLVEIVHPECADIVLHPPPNDEVTSLGQAVLQRVQWRKTRIVVNPTPLDGFVNAPKDPLEPPKENTKSASAAKSSSAKVPSNDNSGGHTKIASAAPKPTTDSKGPIGAATSHENFGTTKSAPGAPSKAPLKEISASAKGGKDSGVDAGPEKQKTVANARTRAQTNRSKKAAPEKHPEVAKVWTEANPDFIYGRPMLTENELQNAGTATVALHKYYMEGCMRKQKVIMVTFKRFHLLCPEDEVYIPVGFNDLYDVFALNGLDVWIIRIFTLAMVQEAKEKKVQVGFLCPQMVSFSSIKEDEARVVKYLTKAMAHHAKKEYILSFYNTGGHWIVLVIMQRWNKVLYLDSIKGKAKDYALLQSVLNAALCKRRGKQEEVTHLTRYACHQQPPGTSCGFFAAHHMMASMGNTGIQQPEEFEVLTSTMKEDTLHDIREKISAFLVHQVIDPKGEFHTRANQH